MHVKEWRARVGNLPRATRSLRLGLIWIGSVVLAAVALKVGSFSAALAGAALTAVVIWIGSDIDFALLGHAILGGSAEDLRRAQFWRPHFVAVCRWTARFGVTYGFAWGLVIKARLLLDHAGRREDIGIGLPNLVAAGVLSGIFCSIGGRLLRPPGETRDAHPSS